MLQSCGKLEHCNSTFYDSLIIRGVRKNNVHKDKPLKKYLRKWRILHREKQNRQFPLKYLANSPSLYPPRPHPHVAKGERGEVHSRTHYTHFVTHSLYIEGFHSNHVCGQLTIRGFLSRELKSFFFQKQYFAQKTFLP